MKIEDAGRFWESEELTEEMRLAWSALFVAGSTCWSWPFKTWVDSALVMCPTDIERLNNAQFAALRQFSFSQGETKAYISVIEGNEIRVPSAEFPDTQHLTIYWKSASARIEQLLLLENAIYSPAGKWAVTLSSEEFAVFGASNVLVRSLRELYPRWQKDEQYFRSKFTYHEDIVPARFTSF